MRCCPHASEREEVHPFLAEGSEHVVFLDTETDDVIKTTKPGLYGEHYYVEANRVYQTRSTPLEYLERLRLVGRYFGIDQDALGIMPGGEIISRQPFISGDPPTQAEVDVFSLEAGMLPVKQNCWVWKGASVDGLEPWIGDARDDNFVVTENGIVPVDLRMWQVPVE